MPAFRQRNSGDSCKGRRLTRPAVLDPWFLLSWFSVVGLGKLHRLIHPGHDFVILPDTVGGILMAVAPLLAWLTPSMIVGNLLVAAVSPAKRILDAEAASVPDTDLSSANRGLFVATPETCTKTYLSGDCRVLPARLGGARLGRDRGLLVVALTAPIDQCRGASDVALILLRPLDDFYVSGAVFHFLSGHVTLHQRSAS